MGSITPELNGYIRSSIAGRCREFLRLLNHCREFSGQRRETVANSPTVHPGDRPLAFHRLGYVGQQFQVGVPGRICKHSQAFHANSIDPDEKDTVKHTAEEFNYSEYQRSSEARTEDHRV